MEQKFVFGKTILNIKDCDDFNKIYDSMPKEDRDILVAKGIEALVNNTQKYLPVFKNAVKKYSNRNVE